MGQNFVSIREPLAMFVRVCGRCIGAADLRRTHQAVRPEHIQYFSAGMFMYIGCSLLCAACYLNISNMLLSALCVEIFAMNSHK